jgi:NADPH:quinone reductase-like Zn-dependent oxidoreductase
MSTVLFHKIQDKVHKVTEHSSPEGHHLAAILKEKGSRHVLEDRPTPTPAPDELLIEVHAAAFNPLDPYMRDSGTFVDSYPAILGTDIAGIVLAAGADVPETAPREGQKVLALTDAFFAGGAPDRGAFQKKVVVPYQSVAAMAPWLSFDEACKIPLGLLTAWNGLRALGLSARARCPAGERRAVLIWGASSSVGSNAVQIANGLGYRVFATAGHHNAMYVGSLAQPKEPHPRVFDYKDDGVVEKIVEAMKADGVRLEGILDAVGALDECSRVATGMDAAVTTKLASAAWVGEGVGKQGLDVTFIESPRDVGERKKWLHFVFAEWLTTELAEKRFKPSPKPKLVKSKAPAKGGLKLIDEGIDEMKAGVSGVKLIVEL